jgi:hypothetical protein
MEAAGPWTARSLLPLSLRAALLPARHIAICIRFVTAPQARDPDGRATFLALLPERYRLVPMIRWFHHRLSSCDPPGRSF